MGKWGYGVVKMTIDKKTDMLIDTDRMRMALAPVDEAFWQSERKWGVGRLERLVSTPTLMSYRRGWQHYRTALEANDCVAVEQIAPLMIQALAVMDREAVAAGHPVLAPDTWETSLPDGRVLVVVRTEAEATAVQRSANGKSFAGSPADSMSVHGATEPDSLPVDVALTVRGQHEGRRLEVWTLEALARLVVKHGLMVPSEPPHGIAWEGTPAVSGAVGSEGDAAEVARSGYPLPQPLVDDLGF